MVCKGSKVAIAAAFLAVTATTSAAVQLGIDVLEQRNYALLRGKRVGLVTNQTSVDSRGNKTRILLHQHCHLVALYTPEHGLSGMEKAGRYVRSRKDPQTGLPAYALRPDAEADAGNVAWHRRARVRHPGHRLSILHLHQHNGEVHAGGGRKQY
jgi:uncharacterized protein YbbC (DUF1343 family)